MERQKTTWNPLTLNENQNILSFLPEQENNEDSIFEKLENEEKCEEISKKLNSVRCLFCKKMFSKPWNLKKHYTSCKIIEARLKEDPNSVPESIINEIEKMKEQKKRKIEESNGTSTDSNSSMSGGEMKKIRTSLKNLKTEPVAFYPCSRCLKPCKNVETLHAHLLQKHRVFLEDSKNDFLIP